MSDATALYEALGRCLAAGETTAVATIVQRKGSSPREVGAKMLIRANGDTDGTVGGGCGEADVWRAALDVMTDLEPRTVIVDLNEATGGAGHGGRSVGRGAISAGVQVAAGGRRATSRRPGLGLASGAGPGGP